MEKDPVCDSPEMILRSVDSLSMWARAQRRPALIGDVAVVPNACHEHLGSASYGILDVHTFWRLLVVGDMTTAA